MNSRDQNCITMGLICHNLGRAIGVRAPVDVRGAVRAVRVLRGHALDDGDVRAEGVNLGDL